MEPPNKDKYSRAHLKTGAWAEAVATAWLLELGFEVFKNVSGFGPVDIIGLRDGAVHLFDVKTTQKSERHVKGGANLTVKQIHMGVQLILVSEEGICAFDRVELRQKLESIYGKLPKNRWGSLDNFPN